MARKTAKTATGGEEFDVAGKKIIDTPLSQEIEQSFLEYSYAVIYSRALPDARDGLKPVHRRILFDMKEMGLRPDAPQVKAARVVGDTLGKFHPHGDSSVYDAMVRMAQNFSLNTPMVDGHGNWGSPNDGAAAMRYTECKLASPAMLLVGELNENTVDFVPNYDGSLREPAVLPAAFPNLLVNGGAGIAVGMATNMIPHNAGEIVAAARALIRNRNLSLDKLMEIVPGPDLPTGGLLLGMDQVRAAYETGRGTVRIRAKAEVEALEGSRGRQAITFTELPYQVGTEKIIDSIKTEIGKKRLAGVADVKDLSDRKFGTRLVVECKTGVNPQALLADLYKYTPVEQSFGINNLALVDGQPRTLGLKELLETWLDFRFEVVTRRTQFRVDKAEARKHIVEGLLIALDAIDLVVKTIRASKDTAEAKAALIQKFKLSDIQATHILEMPLRRLVSLEVLALREELADLLVTIAGLREILDDDAVLKKTVDGELKAVAAELDGPRRTELLDGDLKAVLAASVPAGPLEIADDPCTVMLSATGLIARTVAATEDSDGSGRKRNARTKHDVVAATVRSTARGQVVLVTSAGRAFKVDVLSLPAIPEQEGRVSVRGGVVAKELVPLVSGETVVALAPAVVSEGDSSPGLALGTVTGVVKVCAPDWPLRSDEFTVIGLKDGDRVLSGRWLSSVDDEFVLVSSDASLLHFPASKVRPQGRSGSGMAGMKLGAGMNVVSFTVVQPGEDDVVVVTYTGASVKVSSFAEFPGKGRATGGVRSHRFLRDEIELKSAWVGANPAASLGNGTPVVLVTARSRRDGSGVGQDAFDVIGYELKL